MNSPTLIILLNFSKNTTRFDSYGLWELFCLCPPERYAPPPPPVRFALLSLCTIIARAAVGASGKDLDCHVNV